MSEDTDTKSANADISNASEMSLREASGLQEQFEKVAPDAVPMAPSEDDAADLPDIPEDELNRLRDDIIAAVKTVYDPEIPVDIYELGLIYTVDIKNDYSVDVVMTLTTPGCPVAGEMPEWVVNAVVGVDGVRRAKVNLTFDPPWDMSMMSDEARFALNMF